MTLCTETLRLWKQVAEAKLAGVGEPHRLDSEVILKLIEALDTLQAKWSAGAEEHLVIRALKLYCRMRSVAYGEQASEKITLEEVLLYFEAQWDESKEVLWKERYGGVGTLPL